MLTNDHSAFTTLIASESEPAEARALAAAGLSTLRVVDRWLADGWDGVMQSETSIAAVRTGIDGIGSHSGDSEAAVLRDILDAIERRRHPEPGTLDRLLYAYAVLLQQRSAFAMAIDVLHTVTAYPRWLANRASAGAAIDSYDAPLIDDATLRLGGCYRVLGDHDRAVEAYARVHERASARRDSERTLRARLGAAKIAAVRGNLPVAEWLCEVIATDASGHLEGADASVKRSLIDVRAEARHELANVLHARGQAARAIELVFASWREISSGRERGRMLVDLAAYFRDLGEMTASRDANLLAQRAAEPITRWVATVNLLELAVDQDDAAAFDRYREALATVSLPPFIEGPMHLFLARGYLRFAGDRRRATAAAAQAVAIAEAHHLNKLLHDAETYASTMTERPRVTSRQAFDASDAAGVARVAAAVRSALATATTTP